jgi:hypothetical protein
MVFVPLGVWHRWCLSLSACDIDVLLFLPFVSEINTRWFLPCHTHTHTTHYRTISSVEDASESEASTVGVSLDFVYSQIPYTMFSPKELELLSLGTQR